MATTHDGDGDDAQGEGDIGAGEIVLVRHNPMDVDGYCGGHGDWSMSFCCYVTNYLELKWLKTTCSLMQSGGVGS